MRAHLSDAPIFQYHNAVCMHNGGQAMRNHKAGATAHECLQCLLNGAFAFGVKIGRCFVKDQDARIGKKCSCDGDALPLTTRESNAAFADGGFVTLGHCFDEAVCIGGVGSPVHAFHGRAGIGVANVVCNGAIKEEHVLFNDAQDLAEGGEFNVAEAASVEGDCSRCWLKEASDEVAQGGLACTAGADEGSHFAGAGREGDISQDIRLAVGVAVANVAQCNGASDLGAVKPHGTGAIGHFWAFAQEIKGSVQTG